MPLKIPAIHPLRLVAGVLLAAVVAYSTYPIFKPAVYPYVKLREGVVIEGGALLKEEHIEKAVITLGSVFAREEAPIPGLISWADAPAYLGHPLSHRVSGGLPLFISDIDRQGEAGLDQGLAGAQTGMSIPVDDIVGVTPYLTVGDRVHVFASFEDDEGAHTGLLLREMPVIYLQREMEGETPHLTAVTIALTEKEAVLLTHALHYGKIRLGKAAGADGKGQGIGDAAFAAALMKTQKRWSEGREEER
ncbi:pilus assembly protein CpaB [Brevibacillus sp. SYP-B805]|uniref:RcpC/CpaB family pilus assembly protein n=1 Tax=Brevibacillus sp. SYP-B805 TaxID=1578199 RepID=UPI0013EA4A47|nr:RcpC/CpaB family pilus assembly protein [Brevibacillus sp. SYP-B805]NGQ96443.1 pilus assembly protein CpaB [Brevibacillus sp. SYP-B805]